MGTRGRWVWMLIAGALTACLATGVWGAVDPAFDALLKMAEQGNPEVARRVATAYDSGMGAPLDAVEAARWYERAARRGDADSQFRLGAMYREGRGVLRDSRRAYAWFDLAASNPDFLDSDDAATYRDEAMRAMDPPDLAAARELARAWKAAGEGGGSTP